MTAITTETSVHFQNGRSAGLGDSLGFRRWMAVIDGAIEVGGFSADYKADSDAYKAAMGEARDGFMTVGSKDTFDKSATYLRKIRAAFPSTTVDEMVKSYGNLNKAYKAAQRELAPKDGNGNPVVTKKTKDERGGDFDATARLALAAGWTVAELTARLEKVADSM